MHLQNFGHASAPFRRYFAPQYGHDADGLAADNGKKTRGCKFHFSAPFGGQVSGKSSGETSRATGAGRVNPDGAETERDAECAGWAGWVGVIFRLPESAIRPNGRLRRGRI